MGAADFVAIGYGKTAEEAFDAAISDAQLYHGIGGYSGTIAEKDSFAVLERGRKYSRADADSYAEMLMDADDSRIRDTWGPAGCVQLEEEQGWMFFGYASS